MNPSHSPTPDDPRVSDIEASELAIAQLVGEVYASAPPPVRSRVLEQLLRPLGVLSMLAVANGVFARIGFRGGWPDLHVRFEDAQTVHPSDVITLVSYVQQVSVHAMDGLIDTLAASPVVMSSGAAMLLMTLLARRARTRRASDRLAPGPSTAPG